MTMLAILALFGLPAPALAPTIEGDGIVEFRLVNGKDEDAFCGLPNTDGTEIPPSSASKLTKEKKLSSDQCEEMCKAQGPEGCFAYAVSKWSCRLYTQAVSTEVTVTKPGWTGCYARVGPKDCWNYCSMRPGPCGWCGNGKKCCRKGWGNGEDGCSVTEGGEEFHQCVATDREGDRTGAAERCDEFSEPKCTGACKYNPGSWFFGIGAGCELDTVNINGGF